jgi:hypothetical protein
VLPCYNDAAAAADALTAARRAGRVKLLSSNRVEYPGASICPRCAASSKPG